MTDSSLKTLFHPFEAGLLDPPGEGGRVLFLNAAPGFRPPEGFRAQVTSVQDFRPAFLALEAERRRPVPQPENGDYDLALVLAGRHRGQNELWIADALRRVREGARVVVAGAKTDGIASLRKRVGQLSPLDDHASKHHGVAFWLTRSQNALKAAAALEAANPPRTVEGGFRTAPGLFSHDRVDPASRLLAESLPADIAGEAADFGAGWGFLSVELARRAPGVKAIDLYEAGFSACEAARANMAELAPGMPARALWRDVVSEKPERSYDAIVMNPPFHAGRATEPAIGAAMIRAAAAALRRGGVLLVVANRGLPYEQTLREAFASSGEIARDARFKVLQGRK